MTVEWKFNPLGNTDASNNDDEYFNESEMNRSKDLAREGIQNIFDAKKDNSSSAQVRLFLSGSERAIPESLANEYFKNFREHLTACPDSVRFAPNALEQRCEYLVLEDFGTTGLTGDEAKRFEEPGSGNHFYGFFRSNGKTAKSGGKQGSWGVGKAVFNLVSQVGSVFGLTTREVVNSKSSITYESLLMGRATLNTHQINSDNFEPYGYYAEYESNFPMPVRDIVAIEKFKTDWNIVRAENQVGTSVVVPYCHDLSTEQLLFSTIYEPCGLLVGGLLEVDFDLPGERVVVNSASIRDVVAQRSNDDQWRELREMVALLEWHKNNRNLDNSVVILPEVVGRPDWNTYIDQIPDQQKVDVANIFAEHGKVLLRIPVKVLPSSQELQSGSFDILLDRTEDQRANVRPEFFRDWLRITGPGRKMGESSIGVRVFVLSEGDVLAKLLRAAEGPAHTQWSESSKYFPGRYQHGGLWLRFVKSAPRKLVDIARGQNSERDFNAFPFFPDLDTDDAQRRGRVALGNENGPVTPPLPSPLLPLNEKQPEIQQVRGGFTVQLPADTGNQLLNILVAYDNGTSNPFRSWEQADFRIENLDIKVVSGKIIHKEENKIKVRSTDAEKFKLTVKGFDQKRDICVRVEAEDHAR